MAEQTSVLDTSTSGNKNVVNTKLLQLLLIHRAI